MPRKPGELKLRERIPRRVVKKAWREAEGVSEIGLFRKFRAKREKKMVLVSPKVPKKGAGAITMRVVAFPEPGDMEAFKKARKGVYSGGPADTNPGAIGTFSFKLTDPARQNIPDVSAESETFIQSHFLGQGNPKLLTPLQGLPRRLATKYGGWRKHALEEAIRIAEEHRMGFHIPMAWGTVRKKNASKRLRREIREVCEGRGITPSEVSVDNGLGGYDRFLYILPRAKTD